MPRQSIPEIPPESRLAAIWRLARALPESSYREELRAAVLVGPIIDKADALAKLDAVRCEVNELATAGAASRAVQDLADWMEGRAGTASLACEAIAEWISDREGGTSPL